ncbi:MAG TPA: DUF134 domain-containing protein [Spirochaetota bacterium]|nr:DUF134 domain-containing protein [Spirochaetota bacterium]HSA16211.1 DUF134 domain-containing protein [Spirochaetota bacterium]
MSRKKCCRKVGLVPGAACYRPEGKHCVPGDEVVLSLDEFEAVRLADYAGLYQEDAAQRMGVSRQTFGRIVESARRKIADVLINGRILRIEGGSVSVDDSRAERCRRCEKSGNCPCRFLEEECPRQTKALQK